MHARPHLLGSFIVALVVLASGVLGLAVHRREVTAHRLAQAQARVGARVHDRVLTLARAVAAPVGGRPTGCHGYGQVRCWTVDRAFAVVDAEMTLNLARATGERPSLGARSRSGPQVSRARTGVEVQGHRIEVEVLAGTGRRTVAVAVDPV